MIYKYLGIDDKTEKARISFLQNGLFRFTQPKELNDPKEAKPKFYINEYSPKDIILARYQLQHTNPMQANIGLSDEDLILNCLKPLLNRIIDTSPNLVKRHGYNSIEEYDLAQLTKTYGAFEKKVNLEVGVFSLTTDNKNSVMWSSYCENYKGIVVGFSEELIDLPQYISSEVFYDLEKIGLEVSLNYGQTRFNGKIIKENDKTPIIISDELIKSFLFHKESQWDYEKEYRLISKLNSASKKADNIYLEKIPFTFIKEIFLGSKMEHEEKEQIISIINSNKELNHIKISHQTINELTGEIEFSDTF